MPEDADVPPDILAHLRSLCLALPEAYEEQAWVGTRWRVRKRTFVHVLTMEAGWPPAYARAAATDGTVTVMTFRAPDPEVDALTRTGYPFFKPDWGSNVVGVMLEGDIDWAEIGELLTESFCVLAPKKLIDLVDRPAG